MSYLTETKPSQQLGWVHKCLFTKGQSHEEALFMQCVTQTNVLEKHGPI